MPYSKAHTQRARLRILDSAVQLFCKRGYDGVTLDEITQGAGLTRGAFYAHFDSKQRVYVEAILHAAAHGPMAALGDTSKEPALKSLVRSYLDMGHVRQDGPICPMAFLVTDVAKQEDEIRDVYTQVFRDTVTRIAALRSAGGTDTTLALSAMLIGAVAVARALKDVELSEQLLAACVWASENVLASHAVS
ncbi:TetR/AcrR family transcriptional regulator [Methylosinus sp. Sm6]|uniref:TetR/AcrR family transcriptional regulator n=1 Tax=Methylosinus sp. Sm6 TaxID=2866948 RepID=UPI001C99E2E1|nr:TetR/AcrR family transcriptional regulator [Methylosinus sp. Sm6]MBY6239580.1 TetR/AcrR family transcriptional regulator [Methylosinus sp. Sm6]